ncbi:MAG: hypothetical protein PHF64_11430 [Methanoregula sp.]|nr:hypothetical protein [Methanoregula sp.]
MVKSQADVEAKMKDRVGTAGTYLKKGMAQADDPVDVLLKDPEGYGQKMKAGLDDAIKRGNYRVGLERAKARNAWKNSEDRAAAHFEERKDDMVKNAMDSYPKRAAAIEAAKQQVANMPTATRDQRIAKSQAYLKAVGQEMDKAFGRK